MKGIAHFVAGIAAASCFPRAVSTAAAGNPLYMLLGGMFGLLPDTLDFKFIRFLFRHDVEVQPDPINPDARLVAGAVAAAVNRAFGEGKPVRIKLNTVRLGADAWQSYTVRFDTARRRVEVEFGPVVDTGGATVREAAPSARESAFASLACDIRLEYRARFSVEAFDGLVVEMVPGPDGRIIPVLIPWHRRWTHGFVAALVAVLCAAFFRDILAVAIVLGATATHLVLDHVGYMGLSLLSPFRTRRIPGMKLAGSTEPLPNLMVIWTALLVTFWNLYSRSPVTDSGLNPLKLAFYGFVLPLVGVRLWRSVRNRLSAEEG
ncbi:MAG: metal-dependent hydrolase [Kiritimatiellae bacterium]|nr:metal-dependent hydrolase [Kiritimatiellia bacterium]